MLHVTVNGETLKFDADTMMLSEAKGLEAVTGMTVKEWADGITEVNLTAIQGLVWLLYRRSGRTTAWDDIDFDLNAIDIKDDDAPEVDPTQGVSLVKADAPAVVTV